MTEYLYGNVVGREVIPGLTPEMAAAERQRQLQQARMICPEAPFSDFDIRETGPHMIVFVDRATNVEFRRVDHQVIDNPTAHRDGLACFVIDAGGGLHFLKRRGPGGRPRRVGRSRGGAYRPRGHR